MKKLSAQEQAIAAAKQDYTGVNDYLNTLKPRLEAEQQDALTNLAIQLSKIVDAPKASLAEIELSTKILNDAEQTLRGNLTDNTVWEKNAESLRQKGHKGYKALSALLVFVAVVAGIASLLAFSPAILAFAPAAVSAAVATATASAATVLPTSVSSAAAVSAGAAVVSALAGIGLWAAQSKIRTETEASTAVLDAGAKLTPTN